MDATKIEKFIDAGYTKEEINLLFKDPKIDPKPEPEKDADPQPDPEPDRGQDNDPMAEINNTIKTLTDTVSALSDTVKAMQQNNVNNAATNKGKKDSIADMMQSFVEKL